ncbi:MAG: hypothetical protein IT425_13675 [Pirellulales bacterium]|nr:hypothetical protein [Pirellulales bacterium]
MDQIRVALAWLKQHHFWVLSGLVALIPIGCWWMATQKTSAAYQANQKTITDEFNNVQGVRNASFHPNEPINTRQAEENKKQLANVAEIWRSVYDRQREQALKWPTALSQDFRNTIEKLQFNDEIPTPLRNNYQNYIEQHFPELPKKIGARPLDINATTGAGGELGRPGYGAGLEGGLPGAMPGAMPGGVPGAMPGMVPDDDYICEWLDQQYIRDELNFPQRPSSLRIWVTQEDLWVYHALLDVIAKTNSAAGATRMSNAAVKVVYSLEVGQRAAQYSRQPGRLLIAPPVAAAAPGVEGEAGAAGPGGMPGAPPGMGGPPGMSGPGGMRGMEGGFGPGGGQTAMTPAQEQTALLSWRYLDDKGLPIAVGSAGGEASGEGPMGPGPVPADPAALAAPAPPLDLSLFGKGYKRLPVRMVMQVDVRWLQHFIAICGSQPLRVEVQEVRINPPGLAGMEAGGGGGPGFGGFGGERGFGGPGMGGAGGQASPFPDRTGIQQFNLQPHVKNVVIQGTIYLYNKPNLNSLEQPAEPTAGAATAQL